MTMGEKILNMRKARGWSQEELAENVGVSRQAVSRWESGTAKPDADKIIAICDLFGVSADYLLRDISGQGMQASLEEKKEKKQVPWGAWATAALGASTLLVLKILASVNRIYVSPSVTETAGGGDAVFTPGYYTGFGDYLHSTGLEWLAWLAGFSLVVGGGWLIGRWYWGIWKKQLDS